ncbi:MAG: glycoside hydrolase family 31 protein [Candidatus Pedobacter colombiensis]|uniref:Glycoside hydrolase family 31 protein n=1 Tax=Candidatus Pedobacter colombiensis TaxID=3121371 RepID=A0AAJ5WAW4_9SPHI|nr:TIM-barrel domain-containing protein [Pedobacter sp.]WEK19422.1 MAG: glycoside hydrolase family 31 protein [Pedobacter sp.]
MKKIFCRSHLQRSALLALAFPLLISDTPALAVQKTTATQQLTQQNQKVISAKKVGSTVIELLLSNNQRLTLDFYNDQIFRLFQDNSGGVMRDPEAKPEAKILVENPRKPVTKLNLTDGHNLVTISTDKIIIEIDKNTSLLKIINPITRAVILEEATPISFGKAVTLTLKENPQEYFYGGGVQNGRFSHKGKAIAIENQNSWTDGGVASPTPFYWSSNGYGMMWNTFKKGKYDFGAKEKGLVKLSHETDYLDVFFMTGDGAVALLNDFYQLTGNPVLLPKFGFYQGHLNAYNRDFWKEDEKGVLFEDGKRYKESQKDNGGIKESLNGEKNNYQFSARAVIDRYKKNDMPFGWLLPNDGYGAGYGQTETLDGNIQNLKSLGDYARKNGVQIGLWTQSDLHPKPEVSALLQRDILKEVKDAGVRVLKTDVAWVGAGYSFGLNGVSDVAKIMSDYGNNSRPFIISLDGWAGTQRYAGIWSGDQTGGVWEYIRFHIPTYLGSGLSGQPNITSDVDGIFGGKNTVVNTRDFQWKTFTPMQLNMDGWGANEKYPQALGEPITSINRTYLKLKSELMPYTYSIAKEAVTGLPMIRAMFLEYPNAYTKGTATQYQFLYGPNFLVAPIYQATKLDEKGNDIRNGIYLPEGVWIDYFTGEKYAGNSILNNFDAPLWKLPVFVKSGAIIPMTNPNNNISEINKGIRIYEIYPSEKSSFTEYDDDGTTERYKSGKGTSSLIEAEVDKKNRALVTIHPSEGDFDDFVKEKATEFKINVTERPKKITATIGKTNVKLTEVNSMDDFLKKENVYFYDATPSLNRFATKGSEFEKVAIIKNPQLLVKLGTTDITTNAINLVVEGFKYDPANRQLVSSGRLTSPVNARITANNTEAYRLKPTWEKVNHADFYEIDFNGMHYTTIKDTALLFDGLTAETAYSFKLRAVNKDGRSDWAEIKATTKSNPLQFAIQGIVATTTAENQGGSGIGKLFDFDEGNLWHTKWGAKAVPFDMVLDLKAIHQLDKFHYLPRTGKGNGILLSGKVFYSNNKENWTEAGSFEWANSDDVKIFNFTSHPSARYLKIAVSDGVGGFGSGRELYVFKVPGTESYLPGDINNDHLIDKNDLTSYTNYTGLRKGDADFEGYISNGDINKNNLIDAYDISVVATQLEGGIDDRKIDRLAGKLDISTVKQNYNKDEIIEVKVKGTNFKSVNALSFALPYNSQDYEFIGVQALNMKQMDNLTYDRLHTNGNKALYPTFVNIGNKEALAGTIDLFILKFKAKRKVKFDLKAIDGLLVDKNLDVVKL